MNRKAKRILPLFLSGGMFFILLFFVIQLYEGYDQDSQFSGNPILPGWYADPEIIIFDSSYWIFPTYSAAFKDQVFMDAFSSTDLVEWVKHEKIIDTTIILWADSAMWAPCAVEKEGRFYLFFAANDIQTPESEWWNKEKHPAEMKGGIGVAVGDSPGGPYRDHIGEPLIGKVFNGAQPIDQFVFEENGNFYIIYGGWGRCNLGQLNEDFTGLVPFENGEMVREITPEGYVEGPVIFKREDLYYMMWSEGGWTNESYRVAFGTSVSLEGPYHKQGIILEQNPDIATGAGHHSVLNIPGTDEWYIVYHRRPIPNEGRDHRVTCIDRMYFDEEGMIIPVEMTNKGVSGNTLK